MRCDQPHPLPLTTSPPPSHPPQVVEASDVIIEVLDARDPLGCRCLDVERFVRRINPAKKIVLLLNKIGACTCVYACVRARSGVYGCLAAPACPLDDQ